MTADTRAINCPTCGAGQTLLGGGRVATHACPYCGSTLDALDDFKVIQTYLDRERIDTPLKLGDTGQIQGVTFTVIGAMRWVEHYVGRSWRWIDHQIFSPTHGYGWITREDTGHWTFTRKLRVMPKQWLTATSVETSDYRPHIWIGNERLAYYETTTAEIDYLEGSFNWRPAMGDRSTSVTLLGAHRMITLSGGDSWAEREVEETRLLTPDECQSFGVKTTSIPTHPLAVAPKPRNHDFIVAVSGAFIVLTILIGAVASSTNGPVLAQTNLSQPLSTLPVELDFEADAKTRLVQVNLTSDVNNGWAYFDVELEHEDGEVVMEGGREISFYSGRDHEGSWREGSRNGSVTFEVPMAGAYTVTIDMPEFGSGETGRTQTNSTFEASVRAKPASLKPYLGALGIFFLLGALPFGLEWLRMQMRMRKSDWSD